MTPAEATQWVASATDLKKKYADFQKIRGDLAASSIDAKKYPALASERAALLKRAAETDAKISGAVSAVEKTYTAAKNYALEIGGTLLKPFDWLSEQIGLNGLGALPALIPVAVIAAALAAITFWTRDSILFFQKVAEQKRLEQTGLTPVEASAIVEKTMKSGGGFFDKLGMVVTLAVVAGVGYFGYQAYKKRKGN